MRPSKSGSGSFTARQEPSPESSGVQGRIAHDHWQYGANLAGYKTLTVRFGQSRPALFCVDAEGRITPFHSRSG